MITLLFVFIDCISGNLFYLKKLQKQLSSISAIIELLTSILKRIRFPIWALIAIFFIIGISVRVTYLFEEPSSNSSPQSIQCTLFTSEAQFIK